MIPLICQYKSNSWIQKVELWLPEVGGGESLNRYRISELQDKKFYRSLLQQCEYI